MHQWERGPHTEWWLEPVCLSVACTFASKLKKPSKHESFQALWFPGCPLNCKGVCSMCLHSEQFFFPQFFCFSWLHTVVCKHTHTHTHWSLLHFGQPCWLHISFFSRGHSFFLHCRLHISTYIFVFEFVRGLHQAPNSEVSTGQSIKFDDQNCIWQLGMAGNQSCRTARRVHILPVHPCSCELDQRWP